MTDSGSIDDYITSRLTKDDFPEPQALEITEVKQEVVGQEPDAPRKPVIYTTRYPTRGLVLNQTNGRLLKKILKSPLFKDWVGGWFVAYCDANVSFKGRIIGGIRLREASHEEIELAKGNTPF